MRLRYLIYVFGLIVVLPHAALSKTLILEGKLKSSLRLAQKVGFSVPREVSSLTFRFATPTTFSNKGVSQNIDKLTIKITPEPLSLKDEIDKFGNKFKKAQWKDLREDVSISISFNAHIKSELTAMESISGFPLTNIPETETIYLKATSMVQSEDKEIALISRKLTANTVTEYDAVSSVLNWVSDNIKYTYNPPQYDAVYTLKTGRGNCQNFAHMVMALLRAVGIPSRIVGGITLKRQWKVPVENGYLIQDMGEGGHAWIEVFFPDLGWLSYDPQQSKQFTSTRHIKQTHGLDSTDINDSWSGAPYLPQYTESLNAVFEEDDVDIRLSASVIAPNNYIMSNNLLAKTSSPPPHEVKPSLPPAEPQPVVRSLPKKGGMEFGNMEFPALVDIYHTVGNEGVKIFDKETAEYVTSRYIYAQAFEVSDTMTLEGISLAMRKFGGDGTIFVDVVKDEDGKPSLKGERSFPIFLSNMKPQAGYYWVDFAFAKTNEPLPTLQAGRYWLILRHSGEAIVNWFYIPGNSYGDVDDTRSTVKGYRWEDLLNYDFVFKVKGIVK